MNLQNLFERFNEVKVLIIGDVMLDVYEWGKVERISPEAPVPIISLHKKELRLGGASNVACNIQAMGATPIMCSIIGNDPEGKDFCKVLENSGISSEGILVSNHRITTTKRRVIAGSQHLLRIDHEIDIPIDDETEQALLEKIKNFLPKCQVVIFEDYDKGVITPRIIHQVTAWCIQQNIPVAVDPKKRNFMAYKNVTLFKPNLKELKEGLKMDCNPDQDHTLSHAIAQLHENIHAENYLITLSEKGVFLQSQHTYWRIQAHVREISDVSGAGDTVIAVASLCLALRTHARFMAELSNLAGGLVCEHVGAVPIDKQQLLKEAVKLQLQP